ncbi:MAG: nitroreductase family protein [Candidatus Woesearchaeota archaeon]|nr:MAG: nitroreductase family protein [Candidatus Woesearchaeota archaeon]
MVRKKVIDIMETNDCITTRRSVRRFLDRDISEETIKKVIDAARYAPFGGPPIKGPQLREFIVIRDSETKKKLALEYEDRQFVASAPVIIACCADKMRDPEYKEFQVTVGVGVQNMLLTAHDLGLGACYITAFIRHEEHQEDRLKLIKSLNLPNNIELIGLIALGWPDPSEELDKKELRELKDIIHFEKY